MSLWTLKSSLSLEWFDKWADALHADTNLGKINVTLVIVGWVCLKMDETC